MLGMRFVALITAALLGITGILAQPRSSLKPQCFAIKDARIVTEAGKEIAKGTVVIRDGLIEAVGAEVAIPVDALVMDGQGLVVYPGFIDAGNNWGIDLNLRRSETGPPETVDYASEALATTKADNRKGVTPEFEVATALKVDDEATDGWRKQGFTARLAAPDGAFLAGQSALVSLSGNAPRDSIIKANFAQHVGFRTPGSGYPTTLMGAVAHLRQTLFDAQHHVRITTVFEEHGVGRRPPVDVALTSLQPALRHKQPVVLEADTSDAIHRALAFCDEFKLSPIIHGGEDAWKAVALLKAKQTPVLARINFLDQPRSAQGRRGGFVPPATPTPLIPTPPTETPQRGRRPQTPDAELAFSTPSSEEQDRTLPARAKEDNERRRKEEMANLGVLHKNDIRFAFSTSGLDRPEKFRENLRKCIAEGLPAEAALRALTTDAARLLGIDKQLGSIAVGKSAHLVAMTGDFHDAKSQVRFVFSDGVRFEYEQPERPERARPEGRRDEAARDEAKKDEPKKDTGPEQATELESDRKPKLRTGGNVLIHGATILTVTNGRLKGDVLVLNGKISKVAASIPAPEGVTIIDAEGLYVMPGIVDTHCHYAIFGGINESSLSIVPEARIRDTIRSDDVQIYRALAGGVTAGRLLHGSANVIGGQDAVIKHKYGAPAHEILIQDAPRGVKFALGENVKRTDGRFPNTRLGVEAVLVRAFTEAQAYKQQWADYKAAQANGGKGAVEPRRDLRLEALADILDGKIQVHCHCYRADEILMLLRLADRFGFKVKSLQHVLEGYKIAPEIAAHGASCSTFSDWWAYKLEAYDAIPHNAGLLHEAGALVCLKSDSNELMRHLYQEAAKTMKYGGLSEAEALKTITLNPAKQLGLDQRIGSIEEFKDADLAIFNAHPLNALARCEMTLVEGEVYFQRNNGTPKISQTNSDVQATHRGPGVGKLNLPRNPTGAYVLKNATVHTVTNGVIENATVVIQKGKIANVARGVVNVADATVIDLKGQHVYPGMIDAGTVLGLTELGSARETQDFAEGGDFQPDLRASVGINPDSELIPVTRANGVLTVVTRPGGAVVAGQSALINLSGWVPSEMVLAEPLALHVEFPALAASFRNDPNQPQVGRMLVRRQRDEKIRRVKELFQQSVAYHQGRQASPMTTPVNPRLEAFVPYATGQKPVVINAERKADILEALKLADELKLKVILSGAIDAWKVTDELKKRDVPVILGPVMAMPQETYDPYDAPYACAAKLKEAGVRFCIRSGGSTNTRNLPYEAAMAISYGLAADEGLKAVTLYPAQILGVAEQLGSVETGKLANLVIADGDLLQATTQVLGTFINGTPVEPTSKQTKLYERYRERLQEVKEGKAKLGTK